MKIYLVCLFFILSCSTKKPSPAAVSDPTADLEFVELKPVKPQNVKAIGTIVAQLISSDGTIIEKKASLGDCKQCVRGFGVKELIGVRLEGKDLKTLKISFKQTPKVKVVHCIQNHIINGLYDCKFSINSSLYTLKLSVK